MANRPGMTADTIVFSRKEAPWSDALTIKSPIEDCIIADVPKELKSGFFLFL
jgi:hypothetical protein